MYNLVIQYKKVYIQLPDDDLDALELVKEFIQFFMDREKERLKNDS